MGEMPVAASEAVDAPPPARRFSLNAALDGFFFVFAGIASVWLAWLVLTESFGFGWWGIAFFVLFWLVLAYLVLPRLHRILTTIYVPDYFIGRARTSDGLLGDPVNLAVDGPEASVHAAMLAAGWTRADDVTLASSWRIVTGTLTRKSYDEAPVSPLFLFGRQQDFAYQQEVAGNPAKRHHVRYWRTPDGWLLPGGRRVDWLAAGTFDRAVGSRCSPCRSRTRSTPTPTSSATTSSRPCWGRIPARASTCSPTSRPGITRATAAAIRFAPTATCR